MKRSNCACRSRKPSSVAVIFPRSTARSYASNAVRTLRVLYLLADRGVRATPDTGAVPLTHARAVREAVAEALAVNCPYAG